MLPDEIILTICRYLGCGEILYSLFNLNSRLDLTITDFRRHVSLMCMTGKQLDFVTKQVIPQIGVSIKSFAVNSEWESILFNKQRSLFFQSKLYLMFPQLHTLSLINFDVEQLDKFLDKFEDLEEFVKLDIRNLRGRSREGLFEKILATNNNRLKIVSFDYDSLSFNLTSNTNDDPVAYPNIEKLTVNIKTDKTLAYLFALLPHINHLHINFDRLTSTSQSTYSNVCSLVHLKEFYLRSIGTKWSFDEIANILSKMPSLNQLTLDIDTEDVNLINGKNFVEILPSSCVEVNLFMFYASSASNNQVDMLCSTWPAHIQMEFALNEQNDYGVIHTVPYNLASMVVPGKIADSMLTGFKYTQNTRYLRICSLKSSTDIHKIVQNYRQLQKLTLHSKEGRHSSMLQFSEIFSNAISFTTKNTYREQTNEFSV
ncbi:unnamed protein product [Rotaria sordida]|uniref:F-box domain-containing protein n=1 Tax=Rotaria sordida TaxID=392033 RepID=A0A819ZPE5_9BILA|nr:unnamed protein product [Rotaria sordida]CAF4177717.1 unnamed protein product [Rotaria sordida]